MRRSSLLASMLSVAVIALSACASSGASGSSASTASVAPAAGTADAASAPFVGSRKSKKYYPAACQTVRLIKPEERVGFGSMKDAEAAGFAKDLYSTDCRY